MKRGFKMDIFNTRICFGKFWEQQKKFWHTNFFCWNFYLKKKFTFWGGVNGNLEKAYILNFLGILPLVAYGNKWGILKTPFIRPPQLLSVV